MSNGTPAATVWVVIAAYNEAPRLSRTLSGICQRAVETVVVVDDGSDDETSGIAAQFPIWLTRHLVNCGQGAALQTGIDLALEQGADVIVTFDADGQHCAEDLDAVIEPVLRGEVDVVLGSRFLGRAEGICSGRWLVLKLGVLITRIVSGLPVTDVHNGLRALSRHAARQIHFTHSRMAHASELMEQIRAKSLSYREVPVVVRYDRSLGSKGQRWHGGLRIVWDLIVGRLVQ